MSLKKQTHQNDKASSKQRGLKPTTKDSDGVAQQQTHPVTIMQRASLEPGSLNASDVLQLQRTIGNQALKRLLLQRQMPEEKVPLRGKPEAVQLKQKPAPQLNRTGLPDNLKAGTEKLSGMSMDRVKVHYNSSQPAQVDALAYTQGPDIYVASGQDKHLSHEAWHVVQQAQGRVKPTMQLKDGVLVNHDQGLEHEADVMGTKALRMRPVDHATFAPGARAAAREAQDRGATRASEVPGAAIAASGEKGRLDVLSSTQVIQREWERKDGTYEWKPLIDGVLWMASKDVDMLWYEIPKEQEEVASKYQRLAGRENARRWSEWKVVAHPEAPAEVSEFQPVKRGEFSKGVQLWVVAPGIGVELEGTDDSFLHFIRGQINAIRKVGVGRSLLERFGEMQGLDIIGVNDPSGKYKDLAVVIRKVEPKKETPKEIRTGALGGREVPGGPKWPTETGGGIAYVDFIQPGEEEKRIGSGKAFVTKEGVKGHADFPTKIQSLDVVLFHEFVHAYLHSLGVARRLRDFAADKLGGQEPDKIEEKLVVGIQQGEGLPFSENAYRRAAGKELRQSYQAVGITKTEVRGWPEKPDGIFTALKDMKIEESIASYIAYGGQKPV